MKLFRGRAAPAARTRPRGWPGGGALLRGVVVVGSFSIRAEWVGCLEAGGVGGGGAAGWCGRGGGRSGRDDRLDRDVHDQARARVVSGSPTSRRGDRPANRRVEIAVSPVHGRPLQTTSGRRTFPRGLDAFASERLRAAPRQRGATVARIALASIHMKRDRLRGRAPRARRRPRGRSPRSPRRR